jgi:hypothetical protein
VRYHRGRRHARANQPPPIAHRARLGVAPPPAEAVGRLPAAFAERIAGPRVAGHGIGFGTIAQSQLDRVHLELIGQLVHGRLECERPTRLARRAHRARSTKIQSDQTQAGLHVWAGVEHLANPGSGLRKLTDSRADGGAEGLRRSMHVSTGVAD